MRWSTHKSLIVNWVEKKISIIRLQIVDGHWNAIKHIYKNLNSTSYKIWPYCATWLLQQFFSWRGSQARRYKWEFWTHLVLGRYIITLFESVGAKNAHLKGQLISKCLFGVFNLSQNMNENKSTWGITVEKSNFFVCFLGELKIPKRHFEINWPLVRTFSVHKSR